MPAKTTGAEFKRFYQDPTFWLEGREGTYHDDTLFEVDGVGVSSDFDMSEVPDAAKVTIVAGVVFNPVNGTKDDPINLDTYFRRWQKVQTTKVLVVEADAAKLGAILAAIKSAGGKVVS